MISYPQSNVKLERWHQTLKVATIRPQAPASLEATRRMVAAFVEYYNHHRLHSAIGFIAPADMLACRADTIWTARDQKLEAARARRREQGQSSTGRQPASATGIRQPPHESRYR